MPHYFSFNPTQPITCAGKCDPAQPNPWMDPTHVHLCDLWRTRPATPAYGWRSRSPSKDTRRQLSPKKTQIGSPFLATVGQFITPIVHSSRAWQRVARVHRQHGWRLPLPSKDTSLSVTRWKARYARGTLYQSTACFRLIQHPVTVHSSVTDIGRNFFNLFNMSMWYSVTVPTLEFDYLYILH